METNMEVFQKLKVDLPYVPTIPLLGIYPKLCKSYAREIPAPSLYYSSVHNSQTGIRPGVNN
jgi:hypothetical protein